MLEYTAAAVGFWDTGEGAPGEGTGSGLSVLVGDWEAGNGEQEERMLDLGEAGEGLLWKGGLASLSQGHSGIHPPDVSRCGGVVG